MCSLSSDSPTAPTVSFLPHSLNPSLSFSLSHTHTLTHTHTLSHSHTLTLTLSRNLRQVWSLSSDAPTAPTVSFLPGGSHAGSSPVSVDVSSSSLSFSLSLTHSHTHTHSLSHTLTDSLSHTLTHSLAHTRTHSLSRRCLLCAWRQSRCRPPSRACAPRRCARRPHSRPSSRPPPRAARYLLPP